MKKQLLAFGAMFAFLFFMGCSEAITSHVDESDASVRVTRGPDTSLTAYHWAVHNGKVMRRSASQHPAENSWEIITGGLSYTFQPPHYVLQEAWASEIYLHKGAYGYSSQLFMIGNTDLFRRVNGTWVNVGPYNGRPNSEVNSVTSDRNGNIWVSAGSSNNIYVCWASKVNDLTTTTRSESWELVPNNLTSHQFVVDGPWRGKYDIYGFDSDNNFHHLRAERHYRGWNTQVYQSPNIRIKDIAMNPEDRGEVWVTTTNGSIGSLTRDLNTYSVWDIHLNRGWGDAVDVALDGEPIKIQNGYASKFIGLNHWSSIAGRVSQISVVYSNRDTW